MSDGTWVTTKYGDVQPGSSVAEAATHCQQQDQVIWERRPLYCVPIPGQSAWATPTAGINTGASTEAAAAAADAGSLPSGTKRIRDEDGDMDMEAGPSDNGNASVAGQDAAATTGPSPNKRPQSEPSSSCSAHNQPCDEHKHSHACTHGSQQQQQQRVEDPSKPGDCIVYAYDMTASFSLHDTVEVIGVVSHQPELVAWHLSGDSVMDMGDEEQDPMVEEFKAANPPTSKVMRVHAILIRKNPPLLKASSWPATQPAVATPGALPGGMGAAQLRLSIVQLLSSCLGGDQLAAEYLLMAALSRVTAR